MTTTDDQYVPGEEDFVDSWACAHVTPQDMTAEEAKDAARAFLARVRRDAYDWGRHDERMSLAYAPPESGGGPAHHPETKD